MFSSQLQLHLVDATLQTTLQRGVFCNAVNRHETDVYQKAGTVIQLWEK